MATFDENCPAALDGAIFLEDFSKTSGFPSTKCTLNVKEMAIFLKTSATIERFSAPQKCYGYVGCTHVTSTW